MLKALYHDMGIEVSASCQDWDTKFLSLFRDWLTGSITIQCQHPIGRYVT